MIVTDNRTEFQKFQDFLKEIEYERIPNDELDCKFKVDSYDLFQKHLKEYQLSPDVLELVSKFVKIEKYYWLSATMIPTSYFGYDAGEVLKDYNECNEKEKATFEKQIESMVQVVYENQRSLGYHLDEDYMEIGSQMISALHRKKEENQKGEVDSER